MALQAGAASSPNKTPDGNWYLPKEPSTIGASLASIGKSMKEGASGLWEAIASRMTAAAARVLNAVSEPKLDPSFNVTYDVPVKSRSESVPERMEQTPVSETNTEQASNIGMTMAAQDPQTTSDPISQLRADIKNLENELANTESEIEWLKNKAFADPEFMALSEELAAVKLAYRKCCEFDANNYAKRSSLVSEAREIREQQAQILEATGVNYTKHRSLILKEKLEQKYKELAAIQELTTTQENEHATASSY